MALFSVIFAAAGAFFGHWRSCRRFFRSSVKLPPKPAGHRSSVDLPALVITIGNCRGRNGRARTVLQMWVPAFLLDDRGSDRDR